MEAQAVERFAKTVSSAAKSADTMNCACLGDAASPPSSQVAAQVVQWASYAPSIALIVNRYHTGTHGHNELACDSLEASLTVKTSSAVIPLICKAAAPAEWRQEITIEAIANQAAVNSLQTRAASQQAGRAAEAAGEAHTGQAQICAKVPNVDGPFELAVLPAASAATVVANSLVASCSPVKQAVRCSMPPVVHDIMLAPRCPVPGDAKAKANSERPRSWTPDASSATTWQQPLHPTLDINSTWPFAQYDKTQQRSLRHEQPEAERASLACLTLPEPRGAILQHTQNFHQEAAAHIVRVPEHDAAKKNFFLSGNVSTGALETTERSSTTVLSQQYNREPEIPTIDQFTRVKAVSCASVYHMYAVCRSFEKKMSQINGVISASSAPREVPPGERAAETAAVTSLIGAIPFPKTQSANPLLGCSSVMTAQLPVSIGGASTVEPASQYSREPRQFSRTFPNAGGVVLTGSSMRAPELQALTSYHVAEDPKEGWRMEEELCADVLLPAAMSPQGREMQKGELPSQGVAFTVPQLVNCDVPSGPFFPSSAPRAHVELISVSSYIPAQPLSPARVERHMKNDTILQTCAAGEEEGATAVEQTVLLRSEDKWQRRNAKVSETETTAPPLQKETTSPDRKGRATPRIQESETPVTPLQKEATFRDLKFSGALRVKELQTFTTQLENETNSQGCKDGGTLRIAGTNTCLGVFAVEPEIPATADMRPPAATGRDLVNRSSLVRTVRDCEELWSANMHEAKLEKDVEAKAADKASIQVTLRGGREDYECRTRSLGLRNRNEKDSLSGTPKSTQAALNQGAEKKLLARKTETRQNIEIGLGNCHCPTTGLYGENEKSETQVEGENLKETQAGGDVPVCSSKRAAKTETRKEDENLVTKVTAAAKADAGNFRKRPLFSGDGSKQKSAKCGSDISSVLKSGKVISHTRHEISVARCDASVPFQTTGLEQTHSTFFSRKDASSCDIKLQAGKLPDWSPHTVLLTHKQSVSGVQNDSQNGLEGITATEHAAAACSTPGCAGAAFETRQTAHTVFSGLQKHQQDGSKDQLLFMKAVSAVAKITDEVAREYSQKEGDTSVSADVQTWSHSSEDNFFSELEKSVDDGIVEKQCRRRKSEIPLHSLKDLKDRDTFSSQIIFDVPPQSPLIRTCIPDTQDSTAWTDVPFHESKVRGSDGSEDQQNAPTRKSEKTPCATLLSKKLATCTNPAAKSSSVQKLLPAKVARSCIDWTCKTSPLRRRQLSAHDNVMSPLANTNCSQSSVLFYYSSDRIHAKFPSQTLPANDASTNEGGPRRVPRPAGTSSLGRLQSNFASPNAFVGVSGHNSFGSRGSTPHVLKGIPTTETGTTSAGKQRTAAQSSPRQITNSPNTSRPLADAPASNVARCLRLGGPSFSAAFPPDSPCSTVSSAFYYGIRPQLPRSNAAGCLRAVSAPRTSSCNKSSPEESGKKTILSMIRSNKWAGDSITEPVRPKVSERMMKKNKYWGVDKQGIFPPYEAVCQTDQDKYSTSCVKVPEVQSPATTTEDILEWASPVDFADGAPLSIPEANKPTACDCMKTRYSTEAKLPSRDPASLPSKTARPSYLRRIRSNYTSPSLTSIQKVQKNVRLPAYICCRSRSSRRMLVTAPFKPPAAATPDHALVLFSESSRQVPGQHRTTGFKVSEPALPTYYQRELKTTNYVEQSSLPLLSVTNDAPIKAGAPPVGAEDDATVAKKQRCKDLSVLQRLAGIAPGDIVEVRFPCLANIQPNWKACRALGEEGGTRKTSELEDATASGGEFWIEAEVALPKMWEVKLHGRNHIMRLAYKSFPDLSSEVVFLDFHHLLYISSSSTLGAVEAPQRKVRRMGKETKNWSVTNPPPTEYIRVVGTLYGEILEFRRPTHAVARLEVTPLLGSFSAADILEEQVRATENTTVEHTLLEKFKRLPFHTQIGVASRYGQLSHGFMTWLQNVVQRRGEFCLIMKDDILRFASGFTMLPS